MSLLSAEEKYENLLDFFKIIVEHKPKRMEVNELWFIGFIGYGDITLSEEETEDLAARYPQLKETKIAFNNEIVSYKMFY